MHVSDRTSRRSFLGLLAGSSSAVAGCVRVHDGPFEGTYGQSDEAYDLLVANYDETKHTVSVEISESESGDSSFSEEFELGRKDRVTRENVFSKQQEYDVRAVLDGEEVTEGHFDTGAEGNAPVKYYHITVGTMGDIDMVLPAP